MNSLHSICVFCGSSSGTKAVYSDAAVALGRAMAQRQIGLVYGGGSVGLMGVIAKIMHENGRRVTGIIPSALMLKEVVETVYGELIEVSTMHERKASMVQQADAFIAMPGGFGTLDELFEAITWAQLGIHKKPIGLLNVRGYFDPLLAWTEQAVAHGFVRPNHRHLFIAEEDPAALLDQLAAYEAPENVMKWLKIEQA
ncbi:MAG: TIGR00730 family Rossman fold protein [Anaerolineae bacterium]|nr:TIGR00730 family Rossman fold protein [Anaerolineae bacterium]